MIVAKLEAQREVGVEMLQTQVEGSPHFSGMMLRVWELTVGLQ